MAKNIIFCADGTWNSPNTDENHDGVPDQTNVYKLFLALKGEFCPGSLLNAGEQEKTYIENGQTVQVAKYIHGVGDSNNALVRLLGGATGAGVVSRIVRGYTFISRNYQPGDSIYIVGFSRGAYTARALAGMIASEGLLKNATDKDKEDAYRRGAQVWYRYRSHNKKATFLAKLVEAVENLPAFLSNGKIKNADLIKVKKLAAVAVWDTVGAMGIPEVFGDGKEADAFRFTDTNLSEKVGNGFHAVALDERRNAFSPTLWKAAANVEQVLFPGAHADVGGGYPERGLSDIALNWMIEKLTGVGVLFNDFNSKPNAGDAAHEPWLNKPFDKKEQQGARVFKAGAVKEHPAIDDRCKVGPVKPDPSKKAARYAPKNRP